MTALPPEVPTAAQLVVARLRAHGATLAVAESLTAGLTVDAIASVPGASAVLRGSITAYATELKTRVLGVDPHLLAAGGPVQEEVAVQMCHGAARLLGADHAVATTGVAGPGGADGHPAGTVWVAALARGQVRTRQLRLSGRRHDVRVAATGQVWALAAELIGDRLCPHGHGE